MEYLQENNEVILFQKSTFYLPQLADVVLQDAQSSYDENKQITSQIIQQLHSIFPSILMEAFDIVDKSKFIRYRLITNSRCMIKLTSRSKQFTLYDDTDFCTCSYFTEEVLKQQKAFLCSHVLAFKIAKIMNVVREEVVSNNQLSNLFNNEMNSYLGFPGFSEDCF